VWTLSSSLGETGAENLRPFGAVFQFVHLLAPMQHDFIVHTSAALQFITGIYQDRPCGQTASPNMPLRTDGFVRNRCSHLRFELWYLQSSRIARLGIFDAFKRMKASIGKELTTTTSSQLEDLSRPANLIGRNPYPVAQEQAEAAEATILSRDVSGSPNNSVIPRSQYEQRAFNSKA
jgi:hypothetical protein